MMSYQCQPRQKEQVVAYRANYIEVQQAVQGPLATAARTVNASSHMQWAFREKGKA